MERQQIEIRIVKSWNEDEIVELYRAGEWWKENYDKAGLPSLIAGSFAFAVAIDKKLKKAIGMGRVLSDGVSDAYIQDLIVFSEYRGNQIGTALVQALIDFCHTKGVMWIGLIAEPGTDPFYLTLGFSRMKNYVPMLYTPEKKTC